MTDVPTLPRLAFSLPGEWSQIPLERPDESSRAIRAHVVELAGRADRLATARATLRRELERAAALAREADGRTMFASVEPVPSVPLSVAFTEHWPEFDVALAPSTSSADVMDTLLRGLSGTPEGIAQYERFRSGKSAVARRAELTVVPAEGDVPEYTTLSAKYWITVPGHRRVVLLAFTTPHGDFADPLSNLFAAIVASARWTD